MPTKQEWVAILRDIAHDEGLDGEDTDRFVRFFVAFEYKPGTRTLDTAYAREWAGRFRKKTEYMFADPKTITTFLVPIDGKEEARQRMRRQYEDAKWRVPPISEMLDRQFGSGRRVPARSRRYEVSTDPDRIAEVADYVEHHGIYSTGELAAMTRGVSTEAYSYFPGLYEAGDERIPRAIKQAAKRKLVQIYEQQGRSPAWIAAELERDMVPASLRRAPRSRRTPGSVLTMPDETLGHLVNARVNAGLRAAGILKVPKSRGNPVEAGARRGLRLLRAGRR